MPPDRIPVEDALDSLCDVERRLRASRGRDKQPATRVLRGSKQDN